MKKPSDLLGKTTITLFIHITISCAIIVLGYLYFQNQKKTILARYQHELISIAKLKSEEIEKWTHERLADAAVFSLSPNISNKLNDVIIKNNLSSKNELFIRLNTVKEKYNYTKAFIVDKKGKIQLTTDSSLQHLNPYLMDILRKTQVTKVPTTSELYFCAICNAIHLDFVAPIFEQGNKNKKIIGLLVLRANPDDFLYPFLRNWPSGSRTAETVLASVVNDSTVFLNQVRHSNAAPFQIKISRKEINVAAVWATSGQTGLFEGLDYRHTPVFAYATKIKGTSWVIVSKIDRDEVYKPIQKQAWVTWIVLCLFLLVLTSIMLMMKFLLEKTYFKNLFEKEQEQKALKDHFEYLVKYANDAIFLVSENGQIIEVNDRAVQLYRYDKNQLKNRKITDLGEFNLKYEKQKLEILDPEKSDFYETEHKKSDGSTFFAEISEKMIDIEGQKFYNAIVRDVTDRKIAIEIMNETLEYSSAIINTSPIAILTTDLNSNVTLWNTAAEEMFGWKAAEILHKQLPFVPDNYYEEMLDVRSRLRKGDIIRNYETKRLKKNGETIQVSFTASPLRNGEKQIIGILAMVEDITERKKAEEKILASETRFRSTLENMLEGCQIIGFDWKYIFINTAAANDGKSTPEKLVGHTMMECYPGIEKTELFVLLNKCMFDRISQKFDNEFMYPDGSVGWFSLSIQPIPEGIFILSLNVTERKKAIEELYHSEQRLKLFVEYAPAAIAMFDKDMRYIALSNRFLIDYNIKEKNIIGKSHYEIFPEITEEWRQIHQKCLAGGTATAEEDPFPRAEGGTDWVHWEIHPWYEKSGTVGGILLFSEVITDRKNAAEEIKKLNSELEMRVVAATKELTDLYNNAPCGYHSLNNTGIFEHINETELKWLGYTRDELIGKMNILDILTEESKETFKKTFPNFMKSGILKDLEMDFIRKDRSIISVLVNATAVLDNDGKYYKSRSTLLDNTERKQAEIELKIANEKLVAANKELEAFSYSVSHDLRAPLRGILGFTRILDEEYSGHLDSEGKRICQVITQSAEKMGQLIEDLLAFSRFGRTEMHFVKIDMQKLIETTFFELTSNENTSRIKFIVNEIPAITGDLNLIKQVWINLVSNAIKYSSRKEMAIIEVGAQEKETEVVYYIKDNGVGFDMKYADKLFGVFQRLHSDKEFEGVGAGLATVQRIVFRHGGKIWADAIKEEGATFYFSLPKNIEHE
jgi:PAS domain S-box-containing protein